MNIITAKMKKYTSALPRSLDVTMMTPNMTMKCPASCATERKLLRSRLVLRYTMCFAMTMIKASFMISVGCMPMPAKRSQPLLPVVSSPWPKNISSTNRSALAAYSHFQCSAKMSRSIIVTMTYATTPITMASPWIMTNCAGLS